MYLSSFNIYIPVQKFIHFFLIFIFIILLAVLNAHVLFAQGYGDGSYDTGGGGGDSGYGGGDNVYDSSYNTGGGGADGGYVYGPDGQYAPGYGPGKDGVYSWIGGWISPKDGFYQLDGPYYCSSSCGGGDGSYADGTYSNDGTYTGSDAAYNTKDGSYVIGDSGYTQQCSGCQIWDPTLNQCVDNDLLCPVKNTCQSGVCHPSVFSIVGNVFVDTNGNGIKDAGESNYNGVITFTAVNTVNGAPQEITYPTAGEFDVKNLAAGTYRVTFTDKPAGYNMTEPANSPPSFTVTVGTPPNCITGGSPQASCDLEGNILNLNFGIKQITCGPTAPTLTAAPASPQPVGTQVTLTAAQSGCTPLYRFWYLAPGGSWQILQDYSANQGALFNTAGLPAGDYQFEVWTKDVQSSNQFDQFAIIPYTLFTYTVSGTVFNDANKNSIFDNGESPLDRGALSISYPGATLTTDGTGNYTFSNLPPGTYTVTYNGPPNGFSMTEPKNNAGSPSFTITVGVGCNPDGSHNAVCNANNIEKLDFGITNSVTWTDSGVCEVTDPSCTITKGTGDWRYDNGVTDFLPANGTCGGASNSFAQHDGAGGNVGNILFTGDTNPSFGTNGGQASAQNWIVGGASSPETFSPVHSGQIRTSYNYILANVTEQGTTQTNLANVPACSGGNCSMNGLPQGFYIYHGNMTLTATTITSGTYILLVDGNLTINGNILVSPGAFFIVSTSGNIHIANTVGETSPTSRTADIEGMLSSDKSIIIDSVGTAGDNCAVNNPDKRLNILGALVTNAAGGGGTLVNNRDLCAGNISCPAVGIGQRPDFLLDMPVILRHPNSVWQEVAP